MIVSLSRRSISLFVTIVLLMGPLSSFGAESFKEVPKTIEDLRALQDQVKKVLKKVIPATVGLRVGGASGSGVIISKDGYILTAGHVSGAANRDVTIFLSNGKRLKGKTLGANRGIDSGLIKITEKGIYPFVQMGNADKVSRGQWCIAVGHPGGFQRGRSPVVRLGRVQQVSDSIVRTDCALVGGDSGGPLFDLHGKVIGIHSRIGPSMSYNIHVPVDTYRDTWDRLVKAEVWGGRSIFRSNVPYMGVIGDLEAKSCTISQVVPKSPADQAGLEAGDVILKFDGKSLNRYADLRPLIRDKKIGDTVPLIVMRDGKSLKLKLKLGRRGG